LAGPGGRIAPDLPVGLDRNLHGLDRDLDVLGKVRYDVAINRSEWRDSAGNRLDGLEEFYQVARQKLGEIVATKYWLWLSRIETLPVELRQDYVRIAANVLSTPAAGDADLPLHIEKYRGYLRSGSRVLLVSHSQGNLYANQAWSSLFGGGRNSVFVQSLGNVQVATPASVISSSQILRFGQQLGTWQTFPDDDVIANVRDFAGALPANLPAEGKIGDPALGHNFVNAYMRAGSTSFARIVADMKNVARVLVYPTGISDLSAQQSESSAFADLVDDANNVDPTPVEPGKSLYLEGAGLAGAQFVVPGVTQKLTAQAVDLPTDHPLYIAGSEVWKLSIPASAVPGSSGVIRALIAIDGVEQGFESPRAVRIESPDGIVYRIQRYLHHAGENPLASSVSCQMSLYRLQKSRLQIGSGPDKDREFERVDSVRCSDKDVDNDAIGSVTFENMTAPYAHFRETTRLTTFYSANVGLFVGTDEKLGFSEYEVVTSSDGICTKTLQKQRQRRVYTEVRYFCQNPSIDPTACQQSAGGEGWGPWTVFDEGELDPLITETIPCSQANETIQTYAN
jgi:hypothetical protein